MKLTANQMKKLSNLYNDYVAIETETDLRKRKLSFSDYSMIPAIFKEIQRNGSTETFISSISEYFRKHGFTVAREEVNYKISL